MSPIAYALCAFGWGGAAGIALGLWMGIRIGGSHEQIRWNEELVQLEQVKATDAGKWSSICDFAQKRAAEHKP